MRKSRFRPMGLGDILDEAFDLYKNNFSLFAGIGAIVFFPVSFYCGIIIARLIAMENALQAGRYMGSNPTSSFAGFFIVVIGFALLYPIITCAFTYAISQRYIDATTSIGKTYGYTLRRVGAIIWTAILSSLCMMGINLVAYIPSIAVLSRPGLFIIFRLLGAVIVYYVGARLTFGYTALVVDGKSGTAALKRSWDLSNGYGWRIFGILFITGIIVGIIALVTILAFSLLLRVVSSGQLSSSFGLMIGTFGGIMAVLLMPIMVLVIVLLYYDLRIRKEGFDLQMLAQDLARGGIGKAGYTQESIPGYQNQHQPTYQSKPNPYGLLTGPAQPQQSLTGQQPVTQQPQQPPTNQQPHTQRPVAPKQQPTCSYCRYPIRSPEEGVMCPSCHVVLHRSCWNEHKGCTTPGCPASPKQGSSGQ